MHGEHWPYEGSSSSLRPPGVSLVPEADNEEGEARELPASPALLPGFSTALRVREGAGSPLLPTPCPGAPAGPGPGRAGLPLEPGSPRES